MASSGFMLSLGKLVYSRPKCWPGGELQLLAQEEHRSAGVNARAGSALVSRPAQQKEGKFQPPANRAAITTQ